MRILKKKKEEKSEACSLLAIHLPVQGLGKFGKIPTNLSRNIWDSDIDWLETLSRPAICLPQLQGTQGMSFKDQVPLMKKSMP